MMTNETTPKCIALIPVNIPIEIVDVCYCCYSHRPPRIWTHEKIMHKQQPKKKRDVHYDVNKKKTTRRIYTRIIHKRIITISVTAHTQKTGFHCTKICVYTHTYVCTYSGAKSKKRRAIALRRLLACHFCALHFEKCATFWWVWRGGVVWVLFIRYSPKNIFFYMFIATLSDEIRFVSFRVNYKMRRSFTIQLVFNNKRKKI